jgi:hypothetical protein
MKARKPLIYGLEEFGLSLAKLNSLGNVKIKLHVYLRHINEKALFKFKPSQRTKKIARHYELLLSRVKKKWSDGPLGINCTGGQPGDFTAFVESERLSRITRMPEIGSIWIDEVPGRKRAVVTPKERWFAVKARFAIMVEGQTKGLQTYEDRIVVVKAISFEDAEKKLQPEFKRYGDPYLNSQGFMVRWAYERVLDVYEILEERLDPRGGEVFSILGKRRIKLKYAWKPERKEKAHAK